MIFCEVNISCWSWKKKETLSFGVGNVSCISNFEAGYFFFKIFTKSAQWFFSKTGMVSLDFLRMWLRNLWLQVVGNFLGDDLNYTHITGKHIHWPGPKGTPPANRPVCGFKGEDLECQTNGKRVETKALDKQTPESTIIRLVRGLHPCWIFHEKYILDAWTLWQGNIFCPLTFQTVSFVFFTFS